MGKQLTLAVAALTLVAMGCGSEKINRSTASFSADAVLDFETVEVTKSKVKTLTLSNEGGTDIAVESIDIAAPFRTTAELPVVLPRAQTTTIDVYYEPTELKLEPHAFAMVLHNTSEDNPEAVVQLTGQSTLPKLQSNPPSLDFGEVPVHTTRDAQNIVIENLGNMPITVTAVSGLDERIFNLNGAQLAGRTYEPGQKVVFTLSYTPSAGKVDDTTLVLTTDDTVQPKLEIPIKAKGLEAIVSLCWHFDGEADTCIPRDPGTGGAITADIVEFGIIPEKDENGQPQPKTLTLTLKNEGNSQATVMGLNSGGLQAVDKTSVDPNKCPGVPAPRPADFVFAPTGFATLDEVGGPAAEQQMLVTYTPHHECQLDIDDKAIIWIQAGPKTLQLELHGASAVGMARMTDLNFSIGGHAVSKDIQVENIGYGPLHVSNMELVQGDANANSNTNCQAHCSTRPVCPPPSDGSPKECNVFQWDDGPDPVVVAPGSDPAHGQTNSGQVGIILVDPSKPGFGSVPTCACLRAATDDLVVPVVCGRICAAN